MPYTPELDASACTTLRRLSWAINEPMTTTMREIFQFLPLIMDSGKVCAHCEDQSKCDSCYFSKAKEEDFKSELFTEVVNKQALEETFFKSRLTERTKPKKEKKLKLCKSCQKKVDSQQNKQEQESSENNKKYVSDVVENYNRRNRI